jgi:hypothetical protein
MSILLRRSILALALLVFPMLAQAQTGNQVQGKDKEALEKVLQNFADAYSKLLETKDPSTVLQYVSKDLESNFFTADIRSRVRMLQNDYKGFAAFLDKLTKTDSLSIRYKIDQILSTHVRGNAGFIVYTVNYENKIEGESWSKGEETVSITFRKEKDEKWRIIYFSVINLEDKKLLGRCYCKVFKSATGDFVSMTVIPNGRRYSEMLMNFQFALMDSKRIIKNDEHMYHWKHQSNELWRLKPNGEPEELLGVSPTQRGCIQLITQKDMYTENCGEVILRN